MVLIVDTELGYAVQVSQSRLWPPSKQAAGAAIAREGLFVIITVVVAAVSLLFNFCLHVYLVLT